jgi:lysophospholipase L1-like esterase
VAVVVLSRAAAVEAGEATAPVSIGDEETIVFYGDSITEQNLYSAYLETFLLSRFPNKHLATFNFGWGGDTASGGTRRLHRDVAPVEPSLIFVNFGMNDGGYKAFDQATFDWYLKSQAELADAIAKLGAKEVLFTTSPVDADVRADGGVYNQTLSRLGEGLRAFGQERDVPVIDLFRPMLEVQQRAKKQRSDFTMIPDAVHPDPVGHLVMAYIGLRGIDAPRRVGEIVVDAAEVRGSDAARVSDVKALYGGAGFNLTLDFLPFYVPPEARPALALVPFQEELNHFVLRRKVAVGEDTSRSWVLSVDGTTAGIFSADDLTNGIDLALLDRAPWSVAGRRLWEAAQYRWEKHQESWRGMGLEPTPTMLPELASFAAFRTAQRAHSDAMGHAFQSLVRPGTHRIRLAPLGETVPIDSVALSPTYRFDQDFDSVHPPEQDPSTVEWTSAAFENDQIDLGAHYASASDVVAYARIVVEADEACAMHLSLGSDDGLAVFLDGKRVFAHDVMRGMRPGEDEVEVILSAGRHALLFKVTQGGGGFGLAVQARVYGTATVRQVAPTP